MFGWCEKLEEIDLRNFIINDKNILLYMFSGCKSLKLINFSKLSINGCKFIELIFKNLSEECFIICKDIRGLKSKIIKNNKK